MRTNERSPKKSAAFFSAVIAVVLVMGLMPAQTAWAEATTNNPTGSTTAQATTPTATKLTHGVKGLKQGKLYYTTLDGATVHNLVYGCVMNYHKGGDKADVYPTSYKAVQITIDGTMKQLTGTYLKKVKDAEDATIHAYLIQSSGSERLIYIQINGEDDWANVSRLYSYSNGKLHYIGSPATAAPHYTDSGLCKAKPYKASAGKLIFKGSSPHSHSLGFYSFLVNYKVTSSSLKASKTSTITGVHVSGKSTGTLKLAKTIKFYKAAGSKHVRYTLHKNSKVKIIKVVRKGKKTYFEVKHGSKYGWFKEPKTDCTNGKAANKMFKGTSQAD
jgi:hypothetical protein